MNAATRKEKRLAFEILSPITTPFRWRPLSSAVHHIYAKLMGERSWTLPRLLPNMFIFAFGFLMLFDGYVDLCAHLSSMRLASPFGGMA